jgi:hypothetical protein
LPNKQRASNNPNTSDVDDAEVFAAIAARSADAFAVGLLQRYVEARFDLFEPVAGLFEFSGEQDLLLGGRAPPVGRRTVRRVPPEEG